MYLGQFYNICIHEKKRGKNRKKKKKTKEEKKGEKNNNMEQGKKNLYQTRKIFKKMN